jgi:hypothetical protein
MSPGRDVRPSAQFLPPRHPRPWGVGARSQKASKPNTSYYQRSPIYTASLTSTWTGNATRPAKPVTKLAGHRPWDQEQLLQTQGRDNMQ